MNRLTPLAIISLIVFSIVGAWYFATSQASAQGVGEGINAQSGVGSAAACAAHASIRSA
jgi:hypothetical protein